MKKPLFSLISLLVATTLFAQTQPDTQIQTQPTFSGYHKNIFVEGLGAGLLGSVNYDMRLNKGRMDGIGFRAGLGLAPLADITFVSFPLEFNHLLGKKRSSFITGIGILPLYASIQKENVVTDDGNMINIDVSGLALAGAYLSLGYRFQPLRNGIMFQINWNPVISGRNISPRWFGLSIGYGFK